MDSAESEQITHLRRRNNALSAEVQRLREAHIKMVRNRREHCSWLCADRVVPPARLQHSQSEAEAEFLTNQFFKQLKRLAKDKEALMLHLEREEEGLTNALQRRLAKVRHDAAEEARKVREQHEQEVEMLHAQLRALRSGAMCVAGRLSLGRRRSW